MKSMTLKEYVLFALEKKFCNKINWYFVCLSEAVVGMNNEYLTVIENNIMVNKVSEDPKEMVSIRDRKPGEPLIPYNGKVKIEAGTLSNLKEDVETTYGRLLVNYLLLDYPFGDKIPYINKQISPGDIEKIIADLLFKEVISVKEYEKFVNNCSFLQPLTKVVIDVATVANTTKPKGIDEFKEKLIEEFNQKHGERWIYDPVLCGNFSQALQDFDAKYLEGDPTVGKLLTSKIRNNARTKMYLAIGSDKGFDGRTPLIQNSLADGFPKDNESLAMIFNSGRLGSFDRGHETQKGGSVAKDLLRSAGGIKIIDGDCGSTLLKKITITKDNFKTLKGIYGHFGDKKLEPIMNPEDYIGKDAWIRTPLFCKLEGKKFCSICVGKVLSARKDGINILFTTVSTPILRASLKGMHNSQVETVKVSVVDSIK